MKPPARRSATRFSLMAPMLSLAVLGLALTACGDNDDDTANPGPVAQRITIVPIDTPQGLVAAEIYAQALSNAGFRPSRKDPVPTREAAYQAITGGQANLFIDTTGDLLTQLSDASATAGGEPPATPEDQITQIKALLPTTLTLGANAQATVSTEVACTSTIVGKYAIDRISVVQTQAGNLRIAGPADLIGSLDAEFAAVVDTPLGESAAAVKDDTADCAVVSSVDPAVSEQNLFVLNDDIEFSLPNVMIPVMTTVTGTPEVIQVLDAVTTRITTGRVSVMVGAVVNQKQAPDVVAKAFLDGAFDSGGAPTTVPLATLPGPVGPTVPPAPLPTDTTPTDSTPVGTEPDGSTPATGSTPTTGS